MTNEEIATQIEKLGASIEGYIPRQNDPDIYALLRTLKTAFTNNEKKGTLEAARQIEEHALFRYAAVAALAGELRRNLEG